MMPEFAVTLRPIVPEDAEFLFQVYAGTRAEELAQTGWDAAQIEAFLRMQFHAQHTHYQQHNAGAAFSIILVGESPAGRLYVDRQEEEIRIVDIALLPAFRNAGIGSGLLQEILKEAREAKKPVRIHVEHTNPALRLYIRLGFTPVADQGIYFLMEYTPPATGEIDTIR